MKRFDKRVTVILNTTTTKPEDFAPVPFRAVINRIKTGERGLSALSAKGQTLKQGDPEVYRKWKSSKLPAVIPAGVFDQLKDGKATHSYAGWSGTHTGFITMDFDDVDDVDALKAKITDLDYVFFCFVSPSGKGIKPFVEVSPAPQNREEHKIAWDALKADMEDATGAQITVDKQCSNLNRLCYLAHDADAYINENAGVFDWEMPKPEDKNNFVVQDHEIISDSTSVAREALKHISADDREDWINVGHALKHEGVPFHIWDEWSRTSGNYNPSEDLQARWDGFQPDGGIKFGSVIHKAKQKGYKPKGQPANRVSGESPKKKEKINPIFYAEQFMDDNRYWYTQEALHQYNKATGIYEPCEPKLRQHTRGVLGYDSNTNRVNEIVSHIADMSIDGETRKGVAFENGVLNLDTLELSDHSPDNYLLQSFPVKWDLNAKSERFDKWIQQVLPDPECQKAIYEMIGSFFDVDSNYFQTAFLLTGAGSNGKSLLLEIISTLIGEDNICRTPFASYGKDRFSVATLVNKTAAIDDDIQPEEPLSSTIKPLITARSLQCEPKYQNAFNFNLQATFCGAINGAPSTTDTSSAFWRRWCVIPFTQTFEKNARYAKELMAEVSTPESLSGILATALSLYKSVLDKGEFTTPEISQETMETMRVDANPVRLFVEDCIEFETDAFEGRGDLYAAYKDWCDNMDIGSPFGQKRFYASLREYGSQGVTEGKRKIGQKLERVFVGLRMT